MKEPESSLRSSNESREKEMSEFMAEMARLKNAEIAEGKTAHLTHPEYPFSPSELTWDDKIIWDHLQNETLTREEFSAWRDAVRRLKESNSREVFVAFIANVATPLFYKKEMEAMDQRSTS